MLDTNPDILLVLSKMARRRGWIAWDDINRAVKVYLRTGRMPWAR